MNHKWSAMLKTYNNIAKTSHLTTIIGQHMCFQAIFEDNKPIVSSDVNGNSSY